MVNRSQRGSHLAFEIRGKRQRFGTCTDQERLGSQRFWCSIHFLLASSISSAYVPTMVNQDEVKDKFYKYLDDVISATPRKDKLSFFMPELVKTTRPRKEL